MTRAERAALWFAWVKRWETFQKRLPALGGWLLTVAGALLQSGLLDSYVAHSDERAWLHRLAVGCLTFGPGALLFTRSVLTGSHGNDYTVGLLTDRRGTGSRTGEMKAADASDMVDGPPVPPPLELGAPHGNDGREV